eukprot:253501_1
MSSSILTWKCKHCELWNAPTRSHCQACFQRSQTQIKSTESSSSNHQNSSDSHSVSVTLYFESNTRTVGDLMLQEVVFFSNESGWDPSTAFEENIGKILDDGNNTVLCSHFNKTIEIVTQDQRDTAIEQAKENYDVELYFNDDEIE